MSNLIKFAICIFFTQSVFAQKSCDINQLAFKSGESIHYEIYYHWGLVWVNAGEANFKILHEQSRNKTIFHITGEGSTYKNYNWFYKVRDRFDSWVDTSTLKPIRYIRNTNEGRTHVYNDNYFNYQIKQAVCYNIKKGKVKKDSVKIGDCTFDVMTMIYYSRCLDYSKYKTGEKIPISLYLDGQVYDTLYIKYLGKETIKTSLGEKKCIKFSPLLISGTIFVGGEGMTVWVTDDRKKIPLLITTPIMVGEIQVKIRDVKVE